MFKNLAVILSFYILIYACALNSNLFLNEEAVVSTNYSSGSFYKTKSLSVADVFSSSGQCKTFSRNYNYLALIKNANAKLIKSSGGGNEKNYYFYTSNLAKYVIVENNKVNLHVAVCKDKIVIGYPFIYYGY